MVISDQSEEDCKFERLKYACDIPEEELRPLFISANDRNFTYHDYQHRLARRVVSQFFEPKNNGVVGMEGGNGDGKSAIAGLVIPLYGGQCQKLRSHRGNTLVIVENMSASDLSQAHLFGALQKTFFSHSNKEYIPAIKDELERTGLVVVPMTHRGALNMICGSVNKNIPHRFADLELSDLQQGADHVRSHCYQNDFPPLFKFVEEWNVTNVLHIVDEYHLALSQPTQNAVRSYCNAKYCSQMDGFPKKFNYNILGISATPDARGRLSEKTHLWNANMFYSGQVISTQENKNQNVHERYKSLRSSSVVTMDEEGAIAARQRYAWSRGVDTFREDSKREEREDFVGNPDNNVFIRNTTRNLLGISLMVDAGHRDSAHVLASWEKIDGKKIDAVWRSDKTRKSNPPGVVYFSEAFLVNVFNDTLIDNDVSQFFQGHFSCNQVRSWSENKIASVNAMNIICPERQPMRVITSQATSEDGDNYKEEFEERYHSLLIGVDVSHDFDLSMTKTAIAANNENPAASTYVFDLTDCTEQQRQTYCLTHIRQMVEDNKKQVAILIRAKHVQGVTYFSNIATAALFFGTDPHVRGQFFYRLARTPRSAAPVGMVLPRIDNGNAGYICLSVCSKFIKYAMYETKVGSAVLSTLDIHEFESYAAVCKDFTMGGNCNSQENQHSFTRFARALFKLTKQHAYPIDATFKAFKYRRFTTLAHAYRYLAMERSENSQEWKVFFRQFLWDLIKRRPEEYTTEEE